MGPFLSDELVKGFRDCCWVGGRGWHAAHLHCVSLIEGSLPRLGTNTCSLFALALFLIGKLVNSLVLYGLLRHT